MKILFSILVIVCGGLLVVYGGYDDSPGAQFLGLVLAIVGVVSIVRSRKNTRKLSTRSTTSAPGGEV